MIAALFQDDEILVIDKPAGLPTQPGEGVRVSAVEAVERDFGFRPFLVHRLDKETSGCLVVARSREAASRWARAFEGRAVRKIYRAVAGGAPGAAAGVFDDEVGTRAGPRAAVTEWRLLGSFGPGYSYMELELGTGRTHQIRIHLAAHGLPILGDDRHGDFALNKRLRKEAGLRRLLLHAREVLLPGGIRARAPIPERFLRFLAYFPDAPEAES
jgi:23S rRNA pseudouridine955/2504/2580 synthase